MSTGQADKPCTDYLNWPTNPQLCGRCAWPRVDHLGHDVPAFLPQHTGSDYVRKRGSNFTKSKKRK